ncbi:MAG: orotate phosphoribosyltransferase [Candidatus Wallbacteria bacterium]|nr:orotate phosphoribosyltransferase [Candidatus Wallbacteria bacterium]
MNAELLEVLENIDAVKKGHFLLSSGNHSDTYFQMALALQHYDIAMEIAENIASFYSGEIIDVVIGPAVGAIVLAHEVARVLESRSIYAERDSSGNMVLRRGFEIKPEERVIVVEDVFTTGDSVARVAELVQRSGGVVAGIATIVNRSEQRTPKVRSIPVRSLIKVKADVFKPDECPLCKKGLPIEKPGSNPKVKS